MSGMTDDLSDIIETLRGRRSDHMASVELLDQAIANLTRLAAKDGPGPVVREPTASTVEMQAEATLSVGAPAPSPRYPGSVRKALNDLTDEQDRDWSAQEVLDEYERRGTPIGVADALNAMFSAMSKAAKAGTLIKTGRGRYKSAKWARSPVGPGLPSLTGVSAQDTFQRPLRAVGGGDAIG